MHETSQAGVPQPLRAHSAIENFHLELQGSANGLILVVNGRRYVIQLSGDTEESFQEVLDAVENAYLAHRDKFYELPYSKGLS